MKKHLTKISTLALAVLSFAAFSQTGKIQPCNTYEAMEQAFKNDPAARARYEAIEADRLAKLNESISNPAASKTAAFEYTVPVVFHVLYECNSALITDAAIIAALKQVNDDYSRNGSDTGQIAQPFRSSYINSEIKFMLAKKDPQGNCITGIVRHEDAKTKWFQGTANINSAIGNAYWTYTWDPTKYLNVYLVSEIVPQGTVTGGGSIVGYTYKPGTWPTQNPHDAVVYDWDYLGTSGNNPAARSLSHEFGHWLSLAHTFGNTNNPGVTCSDDGISDTPITKGEFGGCANSFTSFCTQTNPALTNLNNVQNIMNYSDCPKNFTSGQTTAMRNALGSNVSGRINLSTNNNIIATDVNATNGCNPIAEFFSTNCGYTLCAGSSLNFRDLSNSDVTSIVWSADNGGVVANPNASVTSIMFPTAGTSNVKVTVTNPTGTDFKIRTVTVIDPTAGLMGPQMESFEQPGPPPNWNVINPDNDAAVWTQTNSAAYDQFSSYMIVGALNGAGKTDYLQMAPIDLLNNQSGVFEFAYAYRQHTSLHNDVFKVEGSKDCGGTWNSILSLNAAVMAAGSGGVSTDDFTPASNEWKVYVLSSHPTWQSYKNSPSVMLRFNFTSSPVAGAGNNFFLDAVNFYVTTGVNDLTKSLGFGLYPNPTNGEANVKFNLQDPAKVKVSVLDIMGREVLPSVENSYNAGEQSISVNKNNTLAKGVYFVNLTVNGAKMSSKLVIN